jgi:predicted 2-oxoglutarate/Fe(II)-dependent dioxygenase YbiX
MFVIFHGSKGMWDSVPMVSTVEQSIKDMDMGLHPSCSTPYANRLQDNEVFLPHVDQILCKRHCIRIACDCNGSVCAATFTFFTV